MTFKNMIIKALYIMFFVYLPTSIAGENKLVTLDQQSAKTLEVAQSFLWAAGSGDMKKLNTLMTDDFVWHNEGDPSIPWIGSWVSKDETLSKFLPRFGSGLKTTSWTTDFSFANGDQAVFMGTMSAIALKSGVDTGKFSWAVRVHVENDKVKRWSWFEDSYAVSKAFHAK